MACPAGAVPRGPARRAVRRGRPRRGRIARPRPSRAWPVPSPRTSGRRSSTTAGCPRRGARRRSAAGAWRRARRRPAGPGPGRSRGARRAPAPRRRCWRLPSSAITPCSKAGSSASSARAGPCDARSTPTSGVKTSAGASSPAKRPASTVMRNPPRSRIGSVGIVVEGRFALALVLRQRDPQLRELEPARLVRGRFLGVRDAAARGHEVDLARLDPLPVAEAVGVQDRALDHPAEGLQPDVRMRPDERALSRPQNPPGPRDRGSTRRRSCAGAGSAARAGSRSRPRRRRACDSSLSMFIVR